MEPEPSVFYETLRFVSLSAPNTLLMCSMYLQMTVTLSLVATRLGTSEMSGVSLASLTANLTSFTIMYGLLTAVDTLAPQSYGAGNLPEVGVLVMRGLVCVLALFPAMVVIWLNAEWLLLQLGQPALESKLAGEFLAIHLFSVPALAMFESSRRFLWTQEVSQWPFCVVGAASLVLHGLYVSSLITAMGFPGVAVAHVLTSWTMLLLTLAWIVCFRPHHPSSTSKMLDCRGSVCGNLASVRLFVKIALPGVLSMSEWVFFEAFIAMSGLLGRNELAASAITYNLIPLMFTVPSGVSIATTARVGALLAQGKVVRAQKLARAVFLLTFCVTVTIAGCVLLLERPITSLFSKDSDVEVRALTHSVWPLVCGFLLLDSLFGMQSGLLRALGLQLAFSLIVLVCLFGLGLPLIWAMTFPLELGFVGMWIALPISYVVLNLCLLAAHCCRDWQAYSDQVVAREAKNLASGG